MDIVDLKHKLTKENEILISKNCPPNIVLTYDDVAQTKTDFIIREGRKVLGNTDVFIMQTESSECEYLKIDKQCDWWLEAKHYATLYLENVPFNVFCFEILLKNQDSSDLFLNPKMEFFDYDKKNDKFDEWYKLTGKEVYYSDSNIFELGVFARVSNGWKFYPLFRKGQKEYPGFRR